MLQTNYHSAITDIAGWVKERNPTMGNDNLIVGYCVLTQVRSPIF
ncbi:MAG: hypothetical protein ACBR15_19360 [Microcoleus sp.]